MRGPRLLAALTGALYAGPLLAGLAGHPLALALAFGALMAAWSLLYNPGARRPPALLLGGPFLAGLAALLVLAGRGLAALGAGLALPVWLPLAVAGGALLLALALVPPRRMRALDALLDEAGRSLGPPGAGGPD